LREKELRPLTENVFSISTSRRRRRRDERKGKKGKRKRRRATANDDSAQPKMARVVFVAI